MDRVITECEEGQFQILEQPMEGNLRGVGKAMLDRG